METKELCTIDEIVTDTLIEELILRLNEMNSFECHEVLFLKLLDRINQSIREA